VGMQQRKNYAAFLRAGVLSNPWVEIDASRLSPMTLYAQWICLDLTLLRSYSIIMPDLRFD